MQRTPMTVAKAAEYSGYTKPYLYTLIKQRKIPSYKTGEGKTAKVTLCKEELDAFLFGHRRAAEWEVQEESANQLVKG